MRLLLLNLTSLIMPRYVILLSGLTIVVTTALVLALAKVISFAWLIVTVVLSIIVVSIGAFRIDLNFFIRAKNRSGKTNTAALTFDDGPLPGHTDKLLDILQEQNVKASFFFIGHRAEQNPELVGRALKEGHIIGGHSYWHKWNFGFQSTNKVAEEISSTSEKIKSIIGFAPRFFRPPFGVTNPSIAKAVNKTNVVTIGWSMRSLDTITKNKETLMNRIRKTKEGDIILFHDYCDITLEILPSFISELRERGMKFETLDKFLDEKAYV